MSLLVVRASCANNNVDCTHNEINCNYVTTHHTIYIYILEPKLRYAFHQTLFLCAKKRLGTAWQNTMILHSDLNMLDTVLSVSIRDLDHSCLYK